ncbi:MAG: hypothetical protein WCE62_05190 [Polyangiales bacterium]
MNSLCSVETDEIGNETAYEYVVAGWLDSVEEVAAANTTTFVRDAAGRAEEVTYGLGRVRSMTDYPDGRLKTLSKQATERHFSGSGSCTAPPEISVQTTSFAYTPLSTTVTDPLQRDTVLIQNVHGLPSQTDFPGGTSTSSAFLGQTVRGEAQFFLAKPVVEPRQAGGPIGFSIRRPAALPKIALDRVAAEPNARTRAACLGGAEGDLARLKLGLHRVD